MKAQAIWTQNLKEIEQAENMGLDEPEPERWLSEFHFRMDELVAAWITDTGNINILLKVAEVYSLQFDETLWEKIKAELNDR